jgi:oligosaccharyltransferase complex subunit beta
MQARNSARFTVLGSVESLEDKWFSANVKGPSDGKQTKTVNREFAKQLTAWTFKEIGVIKVGRLQHYLIEAGGVKKDTTSHSGESSPTIYRVKTDVVREHHLTVCYHGS